MTASPLIGAGGIRMVPAGRVPMVGSVATFDEARGLGEIETTSGDLVPFHCTAITDGSRTIAPGATVAYELVAGRLGRLEATAVRPLYGVRAAGAPVREEPDTVSVPPVPAEPPAERLDESPVEPPAEASWTPPPAPLWPEPMDASVNATPAVLPGPPTPSVPPIRAVPTGTPTPVPGSVPSTSDPAALWPLGGGEPTPIRGTPTVGGPAVPDDGPLVPDDEPSPGGVADDTATGWDDRSPGAEDGTLAVDAVPSGSTVADHGDERDTEDIPDGEDGPVTWEGPTDLSELMSPWPTAEEPVVEATATGATGDDPPEGASEGGDVWIRPSFDQAPFTGEVRVRDDPAPPGVPEPRVGDGSLGFRPDFWSPFSRGTTGPPPTWMTPVTRRDEEPPTESEDQEPEPEPGAF